jgi:hypothetical protein
MGLSRGEFLSRIGMLKEIDPLTTLAYKHAERLEREMPNKGAGANALWHVSFHGSSFPGDNPKACGRRAIYTMLDLPRGGFSRKSRQLMDAGKDLEMQLVRRWYQAGMLLSAPPDSPVQTEFEDREHWLTSTVDAIVARPRSPRPVVAEVKNVGGDVMEEMKRLLRGPNEEHVRQVKCEIGLAHEYGPWDVRRCINSGALAVTLNHREKPVVVCPIHGGDKCLEEQQLAPVEHGYLYYVSRDNPEDTREFYFEYDAEFMRKGRDQLKVWRQFFEQGMLPQTHLTGKNPMGWNWTTDDSPCKWCPYGPSGSYVCREDHQESVKRGELLPLADSLAVEEASEAREEYDLDLVRAAVLARWQES